jgi:hypothetical protein
MTARSQDLRKDPWLLEKPPGQSKTIQKARKDVDEAAVELMKAYIGDGGDRFEDLRAAMKCTERLMRGGTCDPDVFSNKNDAVNKLVLAVQAEAKAWKLRRKKQLTGASLAALAIAFLVYYVTTPQQRSEGVRRVLSLSGLSREERRPLAEKLKSVAPSSLQDAVRTIQDVLPPSSFLDTTPRQIVETAKDLLPSAARGALAAAAAGASKLLNF